MSFLRAKSRDHSDHGGQPPDRPRRVDGMLLEQQNGSGEGEHFLWVSRQFG